MSTNLSTMKKIVTFQVGDDVYGFDVNEVVSIERVTPVTELPLMPPHVTGIVNLRGVIVPVIDLRKLLMRNQTTADLTKKSCFVFATSELGSIGCIIDQVNDVVEVKNEDLNFLKTEISNSSANAQSSSHRGYVDAVFKNKDQIVCHLDPLKLYKSVESMENPTIEEFEQLNRKPA